MDLPRGGGCDGGGGGGVEGTAGGITAGTEWDRRCLCAGCSFEALDDDLCLLGLSSGSISDTTSVGGVDLALDEALDAGVLWSDRDLALGRDVGGCADGID